MNEEKGRKGMSKEKGRREGKGRMERGGGAEVVGGKGAEGNGREGKNREGRGAGEGSREGQNPPLAWYVFCVELCAPFERRDECKVGQSPRGPFRMRDCASIIHDIHETLATF